MNIQKNERAQTNPYVDAFLPLEAGQSAVWVADPRKDPLCKLRSGQTVSVLSMDNRARGATACGYTVRFEDGQEIGFVARLDLYVPGDTGHAWSALRLGLLSNASRRARGRCIVDGARVKYTPAVGAAAKYERIQNQRVIVPVDVPVWAEYATASGAPKNRHHVNGPVDHVTGAERVVVVEQFHPGLTRWDENGRKRICCDPMISWLEDGARLHVPADLVLPEPATNSSPLAVDEFSKVTF